MASKPSKRLRGRPDIFEKPEAFRARCEAYFEQLQFEDDASKALRKEPTVPTIARLHFSSVSAMSRRSMIRLIEAMNLPMWPDGAEVKFAPIMRSAWRHPMTDPSPG